VIYQLKEKIIYSEAYLLHFGEEVAFGDVMNTQFPDYTGIGIGAVIYQDENKSKVYDLKTRFEILRMRTLNGMLVAFFDDDNLADQFYSSPAFSKLQEMYKKEFNLDLIRRDHNMMEVKEDCFHIPADVSDEQIIEIQKLLNIYFFTVDEIAEEDNIVNNEIDWDSRLAMLHPDKNQSSKQEEMETASISENDLQEKPKTEAKVLAEEKHVEHQERKAAQKPWWKFW